MSKQVEDHPGDGCPAFCVMGESDGDGIACVGESAGPELESMVGGVLVRPVRRADGSLAVDIMVTEAGNRRAAALFRMDLPQVDELKVELEGCVEDLTNEP